MGYPAKGVTRDWTGVLSFNTSFISAASRCDNINKLILLVNHF